MKTFIQSSTRTNGVFTGRQRASAFEFLTFHSSHPPFNLSPLVSLSFLLYSVPVVFNILRVTTAYKAR